MVEIKKITKEEGMWGAGFLAFLIIGLWQLWIRDFSEDNIYIHIKFFYSLFLFIAISIVIYFVIWKLENKEKKEEFKEEKRKNGKT